VHLNTAVKNCPHLFYQTLHIRLTTCTNIFANTGCILLSSSELISFYIPKAVSAGSLVLHFRCTSNDKNLFNIADQSLQMSKRQKCNKMLCNLTGGSCGFYDMNETRRLVSLNFYI